MKRYSITIIGMGPRGLSILERIAAWASRQPVALQLNLIEPFECGPGVRRGGDAPHLLMSTCAGQLRQFPDADCEPAPVCATPSLLDWARQEGYRRFGEQVVQLTQSEADAKGELKGEPIAAGDFLPRQLLARYLVSAYRGLAAALPPTVTLHHLRHRAIDMFQQPDGSFVVELASGYCVGSDFVFLATGHSRNNLTDEQAWCRKFAQDHARYNSKLAFVREVLPLEKLTVVGADARVAIQGLGLSGHDVVAELTCGRGGRFVAAGSGLRYLRSGHEPRLLLFSRNCLPAAARPPEPPGAAPARGPRFFTADALQALRQRAQRERASPQLDFDRELLPLLLREMAYAWRTVQDGAAPDPFRYQVGADERAAIEALLFPLRGRSFASGAAFSTFFTCLIADDLSEGRRGPAASPAKAAAAALAQARPLLQAMMEHGGLNAASHRKFLSVYDPAIRRLAFGPPSARNEQLLALMEADVLSVAAGPNAAIRIDEERSQFALHSRFGAGNAVEHADVLVLARPVVFSPETDDSPLMRNLLKRGTVRPYYNGAFHPGGLDIDQAGHPLDSAACPVSNLWALGRLVEGPHYVGSAAPDRHSQASQLRDADRCVRDLFVQIAARESAAQARAQPLPAANSRSGEAQTI